jgi:hypothetical protein
MKNYPYSAFNFFMLLISKWPAAAQETLGSAENGCCCESSGRKRNAAVFKIGFRGTSDLEPTVTLGFRPKLVATSYRYSKSRKDCIGWKPKWRSPIYARSITNKVVSANFRVINVLSKSTRSQRVAVKSWQYTVIPRAKLRANSPRFDSAIHRSQTMQTKFVPKDQGYSLDG